MEYIFGTEGEIEVLKTKGGEHSSLTGWNETVRTYDDQIITDRFHVVRKTGSTEGPDGACYDFYEIDRHYRTTDKTPPVKEAVEANSAAIDDIIITMLEEG